MAFFNVPADIAEKMLAPRPGDELQEDVPVLAECWPALNLLRACGTQWRTAGMSGIVIGLDYVAVEVVARARRIKFTGTLLADLQIMEAAVVKALGQK